MHKEVCVISSNQRLEVSVWRNEDHVPDWCAALLKVSILISDLLRTTFLVGAKHYWGFRPGWHGAVKNKL